MTRYSIWQILNAQTIVLSCHCYTRTLVAWNGSLTLNWYRETATDGEFELTDTRTLEDAPSDAKAAGQAAAEIEEDEYGLSQ